LADNKLVNPKLLFALPSNFTNIHNGGVIRIGPDGNVYLVTGEMDYNFKSTPNKARNSINGTEPDGSSGILRFTVDGKPVNGILGYSYPLDLYYAYGIRNSFGMDFDPVTGNLWDTENGDYYGDEINLVKPGFNSGYNITNGIWEKSNGKDKLINVTNPSGLVDFHNNGEYRLPEFAWKKTVGPVALGFLNSSKLGKDYSESMFVSDYNNRYIYNFKLNGNRTSLDLVESLKDGIADNPEELRSVLFGVGLGSGVITDIKTGPDGFLYFLNFEEGKIFRIIPKYHQ
jgi:glucose/arabinose dehydrogenase